MTETPQDRNEPSAGAAPSTSGARDADAGSTPDASFAPLRLPSLRVTAILAAGLLAAGIGVGAAIGPAPESSFAGASRVATLLPSLAASAASPGTSAATTTSSAPPPASAQATPAASAPTPTASAPSSAAAGAPTKSSSSAPLSTTPSAGGGGGKKQKTLPAISSVWLIELSGSTFAQAVSQPSSAPYIDTHLLAAGTLQSGWSAITGSAFASEAPLLSGTPPPQTLDHIVEPPCPEGAAGASCAAETPGALTAADGFLAQALPSIMSSLAYREHGLIVITFGAIGSASASGLPAGAATATLSTEPPAGVLVLSPFVRAGARSASAFDPTSPKQGLEGLLR